MRDAELFTPSATLNWPKMRPDRKSHHTLNAKKNAQRLKVKHATWIGMLRTKSVWLIMTSNSSANLIGKRKQMVLRKIGNGNWASLTKIAELVPSSLPSFCWYCWWLPLLTSCTGVKTSKSNLKITMKRNHFVFPIFFPIRYKINWKVYKIHCSVALINFVLSPWNKWDFEW